MAIQAAQETKDDIFGKFIQTGFDPVQFLNDTLPPLSLSSQGPSAKQSRTALLQLTSTDLQAFLSKLNTHSIKSSSELTTLTDEILRSGNRLAYEVEVLRGDVNSLYELLTESLKDDVARFVINEAIQKSSNLDNNKPVDVPNLPADEDDLTSNQDPEPIRRLRTLGTVKSRLEKVIQVFGDALKWPIPPSEVSVATSLISVSAPELGVANSAEDDKAREYTKKLRSDILETLDMDGGATAGLEAAVKKVNNLRSLSQVWIGTAEEKARTRVVDNLAKLVEDRRKLLDARSAPPRSNTEGSNSRSSSTPGRAGRIVENSTNTAAGLFRNLQKLRDEIYQD